MPENTPRLLIPRPLGNEVDNRAAYRAALDAIDANAAKEATIQGTDAEILRLGAFGDRFKTVVQHAIATNPGSTVYTVGAGKLAILRKVRIANYHAASSSTITVTAGGVPVVKAQTVGVKGDLVEECFRVLAEGDTVIAVAGTGTVLDGTFSLIELPSNIAGANFRGVDGANLVAGTADLLTVTAGKQARLYNLALENGANAQDVIVQIHDGVNAIRQAVVSLAANQFLNLMDEWQMEGAWKFQIVTTQTLTSWSVGGEETV